MSSKVQKILRISISMVVALLLLYFCFRGVKWTDFINVLGESHFGYVILAMAAGILAAYVRALRWRILVRPIDPSIGSFVFFDAFNIAKLADFVIPHSAELIRGGIVTAHSADDGEGRKRASYDKMLGTVLVERAFDIFVLFLLIGLLLVLKWSEFGGFFKDKIWLPVIQRLPFSPLWLIPVLLVILAVVVLCVRRLDFFKGLWNGVTSFTKMDHKLSFVVLTLILWALFLSMSFLIIRALPQDFGLNIVDAMFIMLVGSVAGLVPVPGGFGAFHYLVALALSTLYTIPFEMGIIFATLSHESQAIASVMAGIFSYVRENIRKK